MTLRQLYHNTFAPFSTHKTTELCNDYWFFLFSKSINSQSNPIKILLCSEKFVTFALVSTTLVATASMRFPFFFFSFLEDALLHILVRDLCVCSVAPQIKMQYAAWLARTFFFCGCRALDKTSNNNSTFLLKFYYFVILWLDRYKYYGLISSNWI